MTPLNRTATLLALVSLPATGCLLKHDTHTWYLDPDTAAVVWTVSEQDVRSDASAATDRQNEELAWWNEVQAGNHPMARGLRRLGSPNPEIRVLRSRAPFHVLTEGTFQSIEELGQITEAILIVGRAGHAQAPDIDMARNQRNLGVPDARSMWRVLAFPGRVELLADRWGTHVQTHAGEIEPLGHFQQCFPEEIPLTLAVEA